MDATRDLLKADDNFIGSNLSTRLGDLAEAYEEAQTKIQLAVASRQINEHEGERRLHAIKLAYNEDVLNAVLKSAATQEEVIKKRIADLKAEGKVEAEIAAAVQLEKEQLDMVEKDRDKIKKDRKIKDAKDIADEEVRQAKLAAEQKKQLAAAAVNGYFEITSAFRQNDIDRLEKQKDHELSLVGENAEAKAAIEKHYDEKARELKRRQAIADKAQAAFNIVISTAQAVVKTLAVGGPLSLPLALAIGALGAIQLGVVLAKPLPEFYKGTSDAPEGPAWVAERGYELVESKKGGKPAYKLYADKQVAYLNAHDRVMTHQETKQFLRINTEMASEVRAAPGGSQYAAPVVVQNNGITKADLLDAFASQTIQQTVLDDGELKRYIKKKQQHTQWLNSHFSLPRK